MSQITLNRITSVTDPLLSQIHSLYMDSFPETERRPWDSVKELISNSSPFYSLYAVTMADTFIGFISVWKLPRATYIEHFAVVADMRSKGIGGTVLNQIIEDAGNEPIVVEVELPDSGQDAPRRIAFYERHGFSAMSDFLYFQPPYAKGLPDVQMMLMTTRPLPDPQAFVIILHTLVYNQ